MDAAGIVREQLRFAVHDLAGLNLRPTRWRGWVVRLMAIGVRRVRRPWIGRAMERGPTGCKDDHEYYCGGAPERHGEPVTAYPSFTEADQLIGVQLRRGDLVDLFGQRVTQRRVYRVTAWASGKSTPDSGPTCARSLPSAVATWLFTVPTEHPISCAVSASDSSS